MAVYLERFFRSTLLGEEYAFRNRELHIEWKGSDEAETVQSANSALTPRDYPGKKCHP